MAKVLATIGGVALAPGVSRNRRLYTAPMIERAVSRARERLEAGDRPMVMLTHHDAGDDSRLIAARLTGMTLGENGEARYTADLADTPAAREIASLIDTSDGQPAHLKGVSIRGAWMGKVRRVPGPDGDPVETADDLELDGLDFTRKPGVDAAEVDTFAWAQGGASETTDRVPITETVEAEVVTAISEGTAPAPRHVFENGLCPACVAEAKDPKKPYGDVQYADPGYQKDGKKRYPLDTSAHIRSAWSYINQAKNAAFYTAAQLKRIKSRVKAAMSRIGAKVASEAEAAAGWVFWPAEQLAETVTAEHYDEAAVDPSRAGSWSVSASNGPVNLNLSSYCMDPADLDVILRAAADAACKALASLDPDMDGDVDVPGAGDGADPDDDAGDFTAGVTPPVPSLTLTGDEHDPDDPAGLAESEQAPAPEPAAGETTERTESAMPETTTTAAETTAPAAPAGLSAADVAGIVAQALDARDDAKRAKKRAKKDKAAETAAETARIEQIVKERMDAERKALAEAQGGDPAEGDPAPAAGSVAETDEQRVNRLVEARMVEERQRLVAGGQVDVGRKGLVRPVGEAVTGKPDAEGLNAAGWPAGWPEKPAHEFTPEERDRFFGPALTRHVLGARADLLA